MTHYVNVSTCAKGFSECLKTPMWRKLRLGGSEWRCFTSFWVQRFKAIWSNLFLHPTRPYHISSVGLGIGVNGSQLKMPTREAFFRDGRTSVGTLFWGGSCSQLQLSIDVNERRIPLGTPLLGIPNLESLRFFWQIFGDVFFLGCLGCAASSCLAAWNQRFDRTCHCP